MNTTIRITCPDCEGDLYTAEGWCQRCDGDGSIEVAAPVSLPPPVVSVRPSLPKSPPGDPTPREERAAKESHLPEWGDGDDIATLRETSHSVERALAVLRRVEKDPVARQRFLRVRGGLVVLVKYLRNAKDGLKLALSDLERDA
jgi:hypothetical protein